MQFELQMDINTYISETYHQVTLERATLLVGRQCSRMGDRGGYVCGLTLRLLLPEIPLAFELCHQQKAWEPWSYEC